MKKYLVYTLLVLFSVQSLYAQSDSTRLFIFGHSLIDHRPPAIPTPSDETTVPHWVYLLAQEAGNHLAAGGKYGFLPQHANNPLSSQWGYDIVPGVWDEDFETFEEANLTDVMITAGNFIQGNPPSHMYYGADSIYTPVSATAAIMDSVVNRGVDVNYYLYENWPEMNLANGFPPSTAEFASYNDYILNVFNDWWLEYQDSLVLRKPNLNIKMIPVGPVITKILRDVIPDQVALSDLYEDSDPHGRATIYFMAGLITYMGMYEEKAPSSYSVPNIIDQAVRDNYQAIVDFIWFQLQDFNFPDGSSRVFLDDLTNLVDVELDSSAINLYPNPNDGLFVIKGTTGAYDIDILDSNGVVHQNLNTSSPEITIDISLLPNGLYFVRMVNINNGTIRMKKIIKF